MRFGVVSTSAFSLFKKDLTKRFLIGFLFICSKIMSLHFYMTFNGAFSS